MAVDLRVLQRVSDYATFWAGVDPLREALVMNEHRVTYEQLAEDVARWARWLLARGVQRGDRVALLSYPRPEVVTIFLATASIGGVFQGLNPKLRLPELTYQVADAEPVILLHIPGSHDAAETASELSRRVASIRHVQRGDLATKSLVGPDLASDSTLSKAQGLVDMLDPAALVYTSGSTGRAKGALLPHRGFTWASVIQAEHFFAEGPGSIICNLPIDHVGALGNICATTLVTGGTVVFQEQFHADDVLALLEAERIDYWAAVPAMLLMSVHSPRWTTADLSSLRKIIWSGGAAPIGLIDVLHRRCPNLLASYGLTETVGEVTFTHPTDTHATLTATIGRPEPRYQLQVVDDGGKECDIGERGEIVVRGDYIMRGYLNRPDSTAEAIDPDGWLRTGDVALRRDDGCLVLAGRRTEMFKSGGYSVYPREVELVLERHPAVRLAAIIGTPDPTFGVVGHAFILADPGDVTGRQLADFARDQLAGYKIPKMFTIAPDLPLLPVGKIDKTRLQPGGA